MCFLNSQSAHSTGARKYIRIQCTQTHIYMLKSAHFKLFLWDCKSINICGSLKNSGQLSDKQWSSWEFLTGNHHFARFVILIYMNIWPFLHFYFAPGLFWLCAGGWMGNMITSSLLLYSKCIYWALSQLSQTFIIVPPASKSRPLSPQD